MATLQSVCAHAVGEEKSAATSVSEHHGPVLQNVVVTAGFGHSLDLKQISVLCKGDFDLRRFAAPSIRMREPKSTSLVFASGKIVCTGSKTVRGALLALERYFFLLASHVNPRLHCVNVSVENLVAKAGLGHSVDLQQFADAYALEAVYDSLFPGLRFKMADPKLMVLVFRSGRVVITGAKGWPEIVKGWDKIQVLAEPFSI